MEGQTIYHRASRSVRHILTIRYITIGGESLTPYVVTSQDSDAIRKRLMSHGVHLGVDFVLRHRSKPYVCSKLFLEYINTIFIPYLDELQDLEELEACQAMLLMDICSPHVSDDIVAFLTSVRVQIITFAPHTTHAFQMLDVVLFSALKKHATGLKSLDEEQSAAAFLLKVYHDFKQTMIEFNIWGAFAAIGFTHDIEKSPYGLLFDKEKLRQSSGFVELWDRDRLLESLTKCRRAEKFE
jgi:hypothetical protein